MRYENLLSFSRLDKEELLLVDDREFPYYFRVDTFHNSLQFD